MRHFSRMLLIAALALAAGGAADADLVVQRFGGKGVAGSAPDSMKIIPGEPARVVFDLSAIPAGAKVHDAWLFCAVVQPREPIRIEPVRKLEGAKVAAVGEPLPLRPPLYQSFEATEAVRAWVADAKSNLGLALTHVEGQPETFWLEVRHEGRLPDKLPPAIDEVRAVHRHGQTFLTFREIAAFRPAADKIVWIDDYADADKQNSPQPGAGAMGHARIPGIRLETLRVDLQGLKVRTTPGQGQSYPPFERIRDVPDITYRVYRLDKPITAENFHQARLVGEAQPLNAYDMSMLKIYSHGEYYGKHEQPDNVIGTFCLSDHEGIVPGWAYTVHTPQADGKAWYAVTTVQDGVENTRLGKGSVTTGPLEEKVSPPAPVKYYSMQRKYPWGDRKPSIHHNYLFWPAPPLANLPVASPRRLAIGLIPEFQEPAPLCINFGKGWASWHEVPGALMLAMEPVGDLVYNDGKGTLRAFSQCKLVNYPERYFVRVMEWATAQYKVDRSRMTGFAGFPLHLAIRHPELFGAFWPNRTEYFEMDFDQKWNPASGSLATRLGPRDLLKAPDGSSSWNIFDISWYMRQDIGRDIPFMGCLFTQPKDGNHGAEYGWQDDPKGYSAMLACRQPFVAQWGQDRISSQVRKFLYALAWDKSIPAFSNCSMDNNPGNGDPDDGEPFGQINGYLMWDYDTVVDEPARWEMTVMLSDDAPDPACYADITPRHRKAFNPKTGTKLKWTNTLLTGPDGSAITKEIQSGEITVDEHGLATVRQAIVSKGGSRIRLTAK